MLGQAATDRNDREMSEKVKMSEIERLVNECSDVQQTVQRRL